jgi:hypothetical protein
LSSTRPIHRIERNPEFPRTNAFDIHLRQHPLEMFPNRRGSFANHSADLGVRGFTKRALMINVEQLAAFVMIEEQSRRVEQL